MVPKRSSEHPACEINVHATEDSTETLVLNIQEIQRDTGRDLFANGRRKCVGGRLNLDKTEGR